MHPQNVSLVQQSFKKIAAMGEPVAKLADFDQFAWLFRSHLAHHSEMISPRIPISNRLGGGISNAGRRHERSGVPKRAGQKARRFA